MIGGINEGCNEGLNTGFNKGLDEGFNEGFNDGVSQGLNKGINKEIEQRISTCMTIFNKFKFIGSVQAPPQNISYSSTTRLSDPTYYTV